METKTTTVNELVHRAVSLALNKNSCSLFIYKINGYTAITLYVIDKAYISTYEVEDFFIYNLKKIIECLEEME